MLGSKGEKADAAAHVGLSAVCLSRHREHAPSMKPLQAAAVQEMKLRSNVFAAKQIAEAG